jgi:alkaline phosphatase D
MSSADRELRAAARHFGRRRFLSLTAAAVALAFTTNVPAAGAAGRGELDTAKIADNPFTLGVASGDPQPGSVVLWTRLAPSPYEPGGGMAKLAAAVLWEVATDERFAVVVRSGAEIAHPESTASIPAVSTTTASERGRGSARRAAPVRRPPAPPPSPP